MIKYSFKDIDRLHLTDILNKTAEIYPKSRAMGFFGEEDISYEQMHKKVHNIALFLKHNGIKKGDKVAIWSTNSPNWVISYFAIIKLGAIAVPILPDFTAKEAHNIYLESDAKILFISKMNYKQLSNDENLKINNVICLDDFSYRLKNGEEIDKGDSVEKFVKRDDFNDKELINEELKNEDIASIIFTSGTTGNSKGVVLTHKNVISNLIAGSFVQTFGNNDRFLSVLPLAHTYEFTLGCLIPIAFGSSIYYLKKPPTAPVLLPALAEIKPTAILTVPLIIEKIFFKRIKPALFGSPVKKALMSIPGIKHLLYRIAGKKLYKTFGGNVIFFGIGGAKLNPMVEKFLYLSKFPYSIGYGLTETSPLLAGNPVGQQVLQSTGKAVTGVDIKIINKKPKSKEGEIAVKGPNIMQSYYNRDDLTKAIFTEDDYLKTGDLGFLDKQNNLHIRGRIKNMILGAGGENIYPEEIESKLNEMEEVDESLVYGVDGKIMAKVVINEDYKHSHLLLDTKTILNNIKENANSLSNKFSKINEIIEQKEAFIRTPTNKIKRYLYID